MSLEDAIERKLLEMAFEPTQRIEEALKIGGDKIVSGRMTTNLKEQRVKKLEQDGAVVSAVYIQKGQDSSYMHEISVRLEFDGEMTELFKSSYKGKNTNHPFLRDRHFLMDLDRVALSPGKKRIAFELNHYQEDRNQVAYLSWRELYIVDATGGNKRRVTVPDPMKSYERFFSWIISPNYGPRSVLLYPRWMTDDSLEVVWGSFYDEYITIYPDPRLPILETFDSYSESRTDFSKPTTDPLFCTITLGKKNKVRSYEFQELKR